MNYYPLFQVVFNMLNFSFVKHKKQSVFYMLGSMILIFGTLLEYRIINNNEIA
jgi:hypothetical protein